MVFCEATLSKSYLPQNTKNDTILLLFLELRIWTAKTVPSFKFAVGSQEQQIQISCKQALVQLLLIVCWSCINKQ